MSKRRISRFARNTRDCLESVRELKALGVEVAFEKENLNTGAMASEMFLSMHGASAQEESISISNNQRWSYERRMQSGRFITCRAPYGYRLSKGEMTADEAEAKIIRRIFSDYLAGKGKQAIADELSRERVPKRNGSTDWLYKTVDYILKNEKYTGDVLLQKRYTTDTLPFKQVRNRGEKAKYYVQNSHPAIISQAEFKQAQRLNANQNVLPSPDKPKRYPLSTKIVCGECGHTFKQKTCGGITYWVCYNHNFKKENCSVTQPDVERIFLQLGIRLISINDNYDSAADNDNFKLPLINLLNEAYAIDIGRKTKSQARQSMKDGVYVGGQPPYGYIRSPENRRKLVIDETAAEIVKMIFDWAADGVSCYETTRRLNSMKIPSPSTYKYEQRPAKKEHYADSGLWHVRTVERILANEIYCGRLVQGKTEVVEFRRKLAPAAEWITVTGTHEAIISSEIFETIRLLKEKTELLKENCRAAILPISSRGKSIAITSANHLSEQKNNGRYLFRCTTNRVSPDLCKGNRISEGVVQRALIEQLIQYREALLSSLDSQSTEADISPEFRWIGMELSHMQSVTRSLYEDLINGVLDQQEYMELRSGFQDKAEGLRQRATTLNHALENEKRMRESIHILNRLADTRVLTRENIDRFVDRILVFREGMMHVDFFVN